MINKDELLMPMKISKEFEEIKIKMLVTLKFLQKYRINTTGYRKISDEILTKQCDN